MERVIATRHETGPSLQQMLATDTRNLVSRENFQQRVNGYRSATKLTLRKDVEKGLGTLFDEREHHSASSPRLEPARQKETWQTP